MNYQQDTNTNTIPSIAGGVLFVLVNISFDDIARAVILAAVGAVVSFFVSFILNKLIKRKQRSEQG